jgi:hypothetical protein
MGADVVAIEGRNIQSFGADTPDHFASSETGSTGDDMRVLMRCAAAGRRWSSWLLRGHFTSPSAMASGAVVLEPVQA